MMARRWTGFAVALALAAMALVALIAGLSPSTATATAATPTDGAHLGVASCAGSTCHGRTEAGGTIVRPDGKIVPRVVRHDELMRWQEPSSPGGAHSRAHDVLSNARSGKIIQRLGSGWAPAPREPRCLGCHAAPSPVVNDGVDCESCHGPARGWLSAHYALGATHQRNVQLGLKNLSNPQARASVCLDCHFGSTKPNKFVDHAIMAAGHPRIAFELDLFSTLQQHHDEDADYARRKGRTNSLKFWAVGQAMALERALEVFETRGSQGIFPEFYFFDCHTCHRRIFDNDEAVRKEPNRARASIYSDGLPAFNDENMIMLAAAARIVAPDRARQLEADSRAFHQAIATNRATADAAAAKLKATARALAAEFSRAPFSRDQGFAIIESIASEAISPRFTDYEGSVQAVMAVDTLLNALVNMPNGVPGGAVGGIRGDVNAAYAAVRDPNDYRPMEFRRALGSAVRVIRTLK